MKSLLMFILLILSCNPAVGFAQNLDSTDVHPDLPLGVFTMPFQRIALKGQSITIPKRFESYKTVSRHKSAALVRYTIDSTGAILEAKIRSLNFLLQDGKHVSFDFYPSARAPDSTLLRVGAYEDTVSLKLDVLQMLDFCQWLADTLEETTFEREPSMPVTKPRYEINNFIILR